jgi:hypothetical protein
LEGELIPALLQAADSIERAFAETQQEAPPEVASA